MKTYTLAVIKGDGIGPEVVDQGLAVLQSAAQRFGFAVKTTDYPWSGAHYLKTKELMPDSALKDLADHDAVLLGAIGHPQVEPGLVERNVVAGIRFGLDLYVNLRPIRVYAPSLCPLKNVDPASIDIMMVRENTEDLYIGAHGSFKKGTPDEITTQELLLTRKGTERIIDYAYQLAAKRRNHLTMVDKANAMRAYDLWTRVFAELGERYPQVVQRHAYVDAMAMFLIQDPTAFDVVVAPNLFGDILTDLGAGLQGGMGAAASANLHPGKASMFEPVHGSAPDIAGQNLASPVATVLSIALMLDTWGETQAAQAVDAAVSQVLTDGRLSGVDAGANLGTREAGQLLATEVQNT